MTSAESLENIEAELNDFIRDSKSLVPVRTANLQYPLIILYGETHLGAPLHHLKLRELGAGREAPKFRACEILLRGTLSGCVHTVLTLFTHLDSVFSLILSLNCHFI
jgi:hypothetical protein